MVETAQSNLPKDSTWARPRQSLGVFWFAGHFNQVKTQEISQYVSSREAGSCVLSNVRSLMEEHFCAPGRSPRTDQRLSPFFLLRAKSCLSGDTQQRPSCWLPYVIEKELTVNSERTSGTRAPRELGSVLGHSLGSACSRSGRSDCRAVGGPGALVLTLVTLAP